MEEHFEIRPVMLSGLTLCYELVRASERKSELEKKASNPREQEHLRRLFNHVKKIRVYGIEQACRALHARSLDDTCCLYELKNYFGARRAMCCIPPSSNGASTIALLFEFKGHRGSDNIPSRTMERAQRLSAVALRLLNERG